MNNVLKRSFLPPVVAHFSSEERDSILQKYAARLNVSYDVLGSVNTKKQQLDKVLIFKTPYSSVSSSLCLRKRVLELGQHEQFTNLKDFKFVVAYSVSVNNFRKSYSYNFCRGLG